MARVVFGRLLAVVMFGCAVFVAAAWVTLDRPTAWLARLAGDDARSAAWRAPAPFLPDVAPPAPAPPASPASPVAPQAAAPSASLERHRHAAASPAPTRLPAAVVPVNVPSVVGAP